MDLYLYMPNNWNNYFSERPVKYTSDPMIIIVVKKKCNCLHPHYFLNFQYSICLLHSNVLGQ